MAVTTHSPCQIDLNKGARRHRCSREHAELVRSYRDARHAYELAREARTLNYRTEIVTDRAEHAPVTFRGWMLALKSTEPTTPAGELTGDALDHALAAWT